MGDQNKCLFRGKTVARELLVDCQEVPALAGAGTLIESVRDDREVPIDLDADAIHPGSGRGTSIPIPG